MKNLAIIGVVVVLAIGIGCAKPDTVSAPDPSTGKTAAPVPETGKAAGPDEDKKGAENVPPLPGDGMLPFPGKGYELYSWLEGGQWTYSLVAGTNMLMSEASLLSGSFKGDEELMKLLRRIPKGTDVMWGFDAKSPRFARPFNIKLKRPPENLINTAKKVAKECGLKFVLFE